MEREDILEEIDSKELPSAKIYLIASLRVIIFTYYLQDFFNFLEISHEVSLREHLEMRPIFIISLLALSSLLIIPIIYNLIQIARELRFHDEVYKQSKIRWTSTLLMVFLALSSILSFIIKAEWMHLFSQHKPSIIKLVIIALLLIVAVADIRINKKANEEAIEP